MPDLESVLLNILSRFGTDPAADPAEWPEPADTTGLSSPYACAPTTWGVEEIPEPEAGTEAGPPTTEPVKVHEPDARRRRLALRVDREPSPRGLLVT